MNVDKEPHPGLLAT